MKVHKWIYSGEDADSLELGNITNKLMADELELEKVLGLKLNPQKDVFRFTVTINLNPLRKKERTGPPLTCIFPSTLQYNPLQPSLSSLNSLNCTCHLAYIFVPFCHGQKTTCEQKFIYFSSRFHIKSLSKGSINS